MVCQGKDQLGGSSSGADRKAPWDNNRSAVSGKEMSCSVGHVHCSSREAVLLEDTELPSPGHRQTTKVSNGRKAESILGFSK